MKNTKLYLFVNFILFISFTIGCQNKKNSTSNIETTIETYIDSFYNTYKRYNYDWIDFFEDEFTNVFPDTPIRKISKDSTKAIWKNIYKRYRVKIVDYGKPSFITSKNMVISHNNFNEIFINKQTQDTIKNIGTYIIAWRRQQNNTWKIIFETVQNNID